MDLSLTLMNGAVIGFAPAGQVVLPSFMGMGIAPSVDTFVLSTSTGDASIWQPPTANHSINPLWRMAASMRGESGGSGNPSGIGNGGEGDDGGIKKRHKRPAIDKDISWVDLKLHGWTIILPVGKCNVRLSFDKALDVGDYFYAMSKIFGGLRGVVANIVNKLLVPQSEIAFTQGAVYEMALTRNSGRDNITLSGLRVLVDGVEELSVKKPHHNVRTANVTMIGKKPVRYSLNMAGNPIPIDLEHRTPERPPEGEDTAPAPNEADQAIIDIWTIDFRTGNFVEIMQSAFRILEKRAEMTHHLSELQKALSAFLVEKHIAAGKGLAISGKVNSARMNLIEKFRAWQNSNDTKERVAKAAVSLSKKNPVPKEPPSAEPLENFGDAISMHVPGTQELIHWLKEHGFPDHSDRSEFNLRLRHRVENGWAPSEVQALFDALYNNGAGGCDYIKLMLWNYTTLLHDFRVNGGDEKIRVYVKPSDILPFIEKGNNVSNRHEFSSQEIAKIVEVIAVLRLGTRLKAEGFIDDEPASEDAVRSAVETISSSVIQRGKIPIPVLPSLKASSATATERFNGWYKNMKFIMASGKESDLIVMAPVVSSTEFEWDNVIHRLIAETEYKGRLMIVKPSGELAGDFDPAKMKAPGQMPEAEEDGGMIRRLQDVEFPGGLVEWIEEYLGVSVSQDSIFYRAGAMEREDWVNGRNMADLIRYIAEYFGEGGKNYLKLMAEGKENLQRDIDTNGDGFKTAVNITPDLLYAFLFNCGFNENVTAEELQSAVSLIANIYASSDLIDLLGHTTSLGVEMDIAKYVKKNGRLPESTRLKLRGAEWTATAIADILKRALEIYNNEPYVFILDTETEPKILARSIEEMARGLNHKSWFIAVNAQGKLIFDSSAR